MLNDKFVREKKINFQLKIALLEGNQEKLIK
jgi:hypothetical protein